MPWGSYACRGQRGAYNTPAWACERLAREAHDLSQREALAGVACAPSRVQGRGQIHRQRLDLRGYLVASGLATGGLVRGLIRGLSKRCSRGGC